MKTPLPSEVRDRVFSDFENLYAPGANPAGTEASSFRSLKQLQATPPARLKQTIWKAFEQKLVIRRRFRNTIKTLAGIAAATLGFFCFHHFYQEQKPTDTAITHTKPANSVNNPAPGIENTQTDRAAMAIPSRGKQKSIHLPVRPGASIIINGRSENLTDNDFWMVFAAYTEADRTSGELLKEEGINYIKMDDFRSITISTKMSGYIRKMYDKRKNGKPTWKAKAAKRKLQKLHDREAKFFKLPGGANPLNVLDLVKFIEQ